MLGTAFMISLWVVVFLWIAEVILKITHLTATGQDDRLRKTAGIDGNSVIRSIALEARRQRNRE
jgi:hypothetical protein